MKKAYVLAVAIILVGIAASLYFYNSLPAMIANHWNAQGVANGFSSKFIGLSLVSFISIIILLLYIAIPYIDPLKENIKKFKKYYNLIFITLLLFLLYIHILTIVYNLGYTFNYSILIVPAVGILFIILGVIIRNSERNWFVGIRTPWTLSSDVVWKRTHKLGGILFVVSGILALIGIFFSAHIIWFVLVPILLSALISIVYSYFLYRSVQKNKK